MNVSRTTAPGRTPSPSSSIDSASAPAAAPARWNRVLSHMKPGQVYSPAGIGYALRMPQEDAFRTLEQMQTAGLVSLHHGFYALSYEGVLAHLNPHRRERYLALASLCS